MVARAPLDSFRVMVAVSTSPASPMAGSMRQAPWAYSSTISWPDRYRTISRSWIIMSMKMPPDRATYWAGGGSGSRELIRTYWTSPILPEATASFMAR